MTKLALSKSSLLEQRRNLETYHQFLPSLDLKRKQLLMEKLKVEKEVEDISTQLKDLVFKTSKEIKMLGNEEMDLEDIVVLKSIIYKEKNHLGVVIQEIDKIDIVTKQYGLLGKPHWVDLLVKRLSMACELKVKLFNARERLDLFRQATRKVSQRVNLISKILIPQASTNIRTIQIYLSDGERAAVVRSKIAKKKRRYLLDEKCK